MPHPMLYGSCLCGYVPYAHGLWSDPAEWIILRIAHKRKLANSFILFGATNNFSCLILPIIHACNVGISRLRSKDATPIICPTPIERHDSDRMPDSGRRTWLWSYARLRSEDMTLVVYPDSRRTFRFQSCMWQTPPEKAGVYLPRSYRGILDEARMHKHTYKHTIPWYLSYKLVITY
jgi:hypothetical protein